MVRQKQQLGQFFTKNSDYILKGFGKYIEGKEVVDPFAGGSDLISWAEKNRAKKIVGYDIDKKYIDDKTIFLNDSINNPSEYKFVLANPPYLHKNKANNETKQKYFGGANAQFEDLYQVSINSILNSEEGILIVPLNFLSAENSNKTRRLFFEKFKIVSLNIFEEQVFEDTTYNVISFYYKKKMRQSEKNIIDTHVFPNNKKIKFMLDKKHGWQLGGEFRSKIDPVGNLLGVYRATEDLISDGNEKVELAYTNVKDRRTCNVSKHIKQLLEKNIILLRAIDSKNGKKIQLEDIRKYGSIALIGKNTSRNMAYLLFEDQVSLDEQKKIINYFNEGLEEARKKYTSLFLTNFRDNNRKRISFDFTYKFINYLYFNKINNRQKALFS